VRYNKAIYLMRSLVITISGHTSGYTFFGSIDMQLLILCADCLTGAT
jgi:hypothetical protein